MRYFGVMTFVDVVAGLAGWSSFRSNFSGNWQPNWVPLAPADFGVNQAARGKVELDLRADGSSSRHSTSAPPLEIFLSRAPMTRPSW